MARANPETIAALRAEIERLRHELRVIVNNGTGQAVEVTCQVCGATVTRLAKYDRWARTRGRSLVCSRSCAAQLGGRASGKARQADPDKRHHLGGARAAVSEERRRARKTFGL